jgi:alpha-galactosidase
VILFNRSGSEAQMTVTWEQLGYPGHISAAVRDLWAHKDEGKFTGSYSAKVAAHGVVMVTVKP